MTDTSIMLASGALFDILNPDASAFTLHDIAHGLGRVCRFAGQSNRFYSVAEHCIHVARLVPVELAQAALLHDASEAFIGDVTRPLKALLPEYRRIEAQIEQAIGKRFLGEAAHQLAHPMIKGADVAMCLVEARDLMPNAPGYWSSLQIDDVDWNRAKTTAINCYRPEQATAAWLRAWHRYDFWLDDLRKDRAA